jgi:hypothetical protein
MKCVHIKCEEKPYYLIVYGCFDEHIRELLFCFHHGEEWALKQHNRDVKCTACREPVEEYEFRWVHQLKGWVV